MNVAAGTGCRSATPDRAITDDTNTPPIGAPVATTLTDADSQSCPYTNIQDWIMLFPHAELSDAAFRLYCISRSMIPNGADVESSSEALIEVTYEEYAAIMGRSSRTISRLARTLYAMGLWEEVERAHRSVRVSGKARPEVRTVLTVRVHDLPRQRAEFPGPSATVDVLARIRGSKHGSLVSSSAFDAPRSVNSTGPVGDPQRGECATTVMSAQSVQQVHAQPDPTECARTPLSTHTGQTAPTSEQKPPSAAQASWAAEDTVASKTPGVTKVADKPSPHALGHTHAEFLADELAMFSSPAVELVTWLYETALASSGVHPLSATDRAAIARRIDSKLAEGWSVARIRAVLMGSSLAGVTAAGRLWAGRLDDMPTRRDLPSYRPDPNARLAEPDSAVVTGVETGNGPAGARAPDRPPRSGRGRPGRRARPTIQINDCSTRDLNAGRARYEVPDDRGTRLTARWADARRVPPWCGRCSSEARTLRPQETGGLPVPCRHCHPEPHLFPPAPGDGAATALLDATLHGHKS